MATASQKALPKASGLLIEAHHAFLRDLPELLKTHSNEWVAYSGERRIGFARTKAEMYMECYRQNMSDDDFVVRCVEPENDVEFMGLGVVL